jgi:hypothetical protein
VERVKGIARLVEIKVVLFLDRGKNDGSVGRNDRFNLMF